MQVILPWRKEFPDIGAFATLRRDNHSLEPLHITQWSIFSSQLHKEPNSALIHEVQGLLLPVQASLKQAQRALLHPS
jgi:hypothetical protein